MTKVQAQFKLVKPLDADMSRRLANTSSLYGILRLQINPEQDGLTVEYDATRLKEKDVEAALKRAGVAVQMAQ
jgi:hypothetical protein